MRYAMSPCASGDISRLGKSLGFFVQGAIVGAQKRLATCRKALFTNKSVSQLVGRYSLPTKAPRNLQDDIVYQQKHPAWCRAQ